MLTSYSHSIETWLNNHQILTLSEHQEEYSDNKPYSIYFEDIDNDDIDPFEPIAEFFNKADAEYLYNKLIALF